MATKHISTPPSHDRFPLSADSRQLALFFVTLLLASLLRATPVAIQIPSPPTEVEQYAAEELALYIRKATGTVLPIEKGSTPSAQPRFLIGPALAKQTPGGLPQNLGDSDSIVECRAPHIVLTGNSPETRGNLYAVYDYLEQLFGIRWLTPDLEIVPPANHIPDDFRPIRTSPAFPLGRTSLMGWVSHYYTRDQSSAFYARMRQTGNWLMFNLGNDGKYGFGIHRRPLGHSIPHLIPHKTYFRQHPEWFALMPDGSRCDWADEMGVHVAQLCLTNPKLQQEFIKNLTGYWRENWERSWHCVGEANVVLNLTQADNSAFCRCETCKAEYQKYGHSGLLVRFIAPALKELEKAYPKIRARTSAYLQTLQPPKETEIPHNLLVSLAAIRNDNGKPLTAPKNAEFLDLMKRWSSVCNSLGYTHYSANYHNFLFPVDNLFVLAEDYRLVRELGVQTVYDLSSAGGMGVDLEELRFYVTAKLQANPDLDTDMLIREFTDGFYGPAAPFVRDYLHLLHERTRSSGLKVESFYKCPAFFDLDYLAKAEALFVAAELAAKEHAEIQRRLWKDRLHLIYMDLLWLSLRYTPPQLEERIELFKRGCAEFNVIRFDEDSQKTVEGIIEGIRADHRQIQQNGFLEVYPPIRYFSIGNLSEMTQPDGTKLLRLLPTSDNWTLQWLCPWFFACPDQPMDVFVRASIELNTDKLSTPNAGVCRGGFNDTADTPTIIRANDVKPGFQLYRIASAITHKKTGKYIFFTALKEQGVKEILVKSFIVRPATKQ